MKRTTYRSAFTLVETLAVMVIIGTISAVLSTVLYAASDAYASAEDGRRSIDSASLAIETLSREIRRQPPPSDSSLAASITDASETSIEFESGLRVELIGSALMLSRPDLPAAPLITPVESVSFRLFPEGGPEVSPLDPGSGDDPRTARVVEVSIDTGTGSLTTRLFLRSSLAGGS